MGFLGAMGSAFTAPLKPASAFARKIPGVQTMGGMIPGVRGQLGPQKPGLGPSQGMMQQQQPQVGPPAGMDKGQMQVPPWKSGNTGFAGGTPNFIDPRKGSDFINQIKQQYPPDPNQPQLHDMQYRGPMQPGMRKFPIGPQALM